QSDQAPEKSGKKQQPTPKREKEAGQKNNKQKPPNTLLSSQTTHPPEPRVDPAAKSRVHVERTVRNPPR
ncbi:hypothetical protein, partial [Mycobacterium sp. PS03-16]|uniref:hypothetical protein n=1 Tax=Mycobacterium sp. PS03-16 TaxID=2559611 RepID=UPI001ADDA8B1